MQKALGARMTYMALNVCGKLDTKRRHLPEWSGRDCLLGDVNTKMNNSGNQVVYQFCPLQIQIKACHFNAKLNIESANWKKSSAGDCLLPQEMTKTIFTVMEASI